MPISPAVNVTLWITPEDANLDPTSGGLAVYDVNAPLSWDFDRCPDIIVIRNGDVHRANQIGDWARRNCRD
jgi:hypothetical protein